MIYRRSVSDTAVYRAVIFCDISDGNLVFEDGEERFGLLYYIDTTEAKYVPHWGRGSYLIRRPCICLGVLLFETGRTVVFLCCVWALRCCEDNKGAEGLAAENPLSSSSSNIMMYASTPSFLFVNWYDGWMRSRRHGWLHFCLFVNWLMADLRRHRLIDHYITGRDLTKASSIDFDIF